MTTLINLTPHPITIQSQDNTITIPSSGTVARVSSTSVQISSVMNETLGEIPVYKDTFGEVLGIPENPEYDTVYIVSGMVLAALIASPNATHYYGWIVAPATGPNDGAVRDDKGCIIAVTRLKGM